MSKLYTEAEPVAWGTADTVDGQVVNGKPRRIWWENNEGVGIPIYGTTQPTEQQPEPDVSALVEAMDQIIKAAPNSGPLWHGSEQIAEARAALEAHRKQGGDV